MRFDDGIFELYSRLYDNRREIELSLEDYLGKCSDDPSFYAGSAERMLKAIGEPAMIDTSQDGRLGRIFMNRTIKVYSAFDGFFGMEDTIERIVGYFKHAAQGLEERRQILYLLGPVGGGKSSLAAHCVPRHSAGISCHASRRVFPRNSGVVILLSKLVSHASPMGSARSDFSG